MAGRLLAVLVVVAASVLVQSAPTSPLFYQQPHSAGAASGTHTLGQTHSHLGSSKIGTHLAQAAGATKGSGASSFNQGASSGFGGSGPFGDFQQSNTDAQSVQKTGGVVGFPQHVPSHVPSHGHGRPQHPSHGHRRPQHPSHGQRRPPPPHHGGPVVNTGFPGFPVFPQPVGGTATGQASGTATHGSSSGPGGFSTISNTHASAGGSTTGFGSSSNQAHASQGSGPGGPHGGSNHANTHATSNQQTGK